MTDTYPPPKKERESIIPSLFNTARKRASGFFGIAKEASDKYAGKQSILMDYFSESGYKIVSAEQFGDIMMSRNLDIDVLKRLEEDARKVYPQAVKFFREKIQRLEIK